MRVPVSRERFEQMVADALDSIPPELGDEMDNVVDEPKYRRQVLALAQILDRLRGCVAAECEIRVPQVLKGR